MARNLGLDDVVDHFTLVGDELDLLRNKSGATQKMLGRDCAQPRLLNRLDRAGVITLRSRSSNGTPAREQL